MKEHLCGFFKGLSIMIGIPLFVMSLVYALDHKPTLPPIDISKRKVHTELDLSLNEFITLDKALNFKINGTEKKSKILELIKKDIKTKEIFLINLLTDINNLKEMEEIIKARKKYKGED